MIRIYKNDCEDFNNNGLGILTDFKTSPKIKESLNSSFELNFDYALKGKNAEYLIVDYIIKAPYDNSEQLFRIKKVTPTLTKISIYAVHIFYDLSENFLTDVAPTKKSGVNAINWILENTMFPTKFSVTGDLISDNSARYVRKNPVDAILGADNCIVKRWGGEIERDNYNIILHKQRGSDKGVYIKQGKNIKEIEISVDFTSVVTRVVPQGANELLLPEYQIDSPLLETYRNPIVAKYEFSDISVDEETTEEQAYEKLREAAEALFSKEGIDKPKIYVKVNWLELSKTEEYRYQYGSFESVRLGDTVVVQALGYEYKIRVITIEYDCLLNRYTSFEIGDPKANYVERQLSIVTSEIQKNSSSLLEKAKKAATTLINNGFGGHVRIYPDRILIMDTENEATAKNVWQWNLNGFAHSSNGINGDYDTAITIDGQIVADRITTGTMDVQRINGLANELGKINTSLELNESNIIACVNDINETKNKIKLIDSKEDIFPIVLKKCAAKDTIEFKIYGNKYREKTNGYQLFDESKLPSKTQNGVTLTNNNDGSFTITGNDTLSANFNHTYVYSHEETVKLLKAGDITISDDGVVGQTTVPYYLAQLRNSNGIIFEISSRVTNSYSKTITQEMLDDEATFLRIGFYGFNGTSITKKTIKPMLYQDGTGVFEKFTGGKSSPSPEYPQEIKTLKGNVEILHQGNEKEETININLNKKNYFNVREYVTKNSEYYTIDENENVTCIKIDSRSSSFEYYEELPVGGTYTLSTTNNCNLRVYESDDNSFPTQAVSFQRNGKNKITFTTTKPYVSFKTFNSSSPSLIGQIKLFEGTNKDESYELAALEDVKDELNIDELGNVELIKNVEKYVFDDERDYQLSSLPDDWECTRFRTTQAIPNNSTGNYIGISDKFITRIPNSESTDNEYILFSNGYIYFSIKKSRLEGNTAAAFKNWIQNNPVTIYYRLAEEKRIPLPLKRIRLFKGTNTFRFINNLDTKLFIKYYLDNEFQDSFSTIQETTAMIKLAGDEIENRVSSTYVTSDTLNNNYYLKTNIDDMIINSETGITNTFSEAGGKNIFRNTGLWFPDTEQDTYEFWQGKAKKGNNDNATLNSSILLQSGVLKQEQEVPNGNYSVSFYYKKLNPVATASVTINDKAYPLDSTETKQFYTGEQDEDGNYIVLPLNVTSKHLSISFTTDVNNSVEIYDLMINKGSVKLAYSQNENEVTTDTVNISKGITITSSVTDAKLKANADGIKILNRNTDEKITEFTDKGMTTKEAIIEEEANICKAFFFDAGDQTWITRL